MISKTELDNIHQLLSCSTDGAMRELGVIIAIGLGMTLTELVDKCVDGWYYDETTNGEAGICYYIFNKLYVIIYKSDWDNRYYVFHEHNNGTNSFHLTTIEDPVKFIKNQLKELFKEYLIECDVDYID